MGTELNTSTNMNCTILVEILAKNGTVLNTYKSKTANLQIVRNEFRDIFILVESKGFNKKLALKGVVIHKKFAYEGKATIKFPEISVNLFISNAPPNVLDGFLKTLFIKLSSSKSSPQVPTRNRLTSIKHHNIEEISPVNFKDVGRLKSSQNNNDTPKRPRSDDKEPPNAERKKLCLDPTSSMNEEQKNVLNAVLKGGNVFFTGSAGTGKSYLLNHILNSLQPDITVATASTGSAACLIGGTTLHSFAGIGTGEGTLERCLQLARRPHILSYWKRCKHLIIDEISMIETEFFQKLEWVARNVRNNDKPFGGIQLIVSGDFLQLPPVSKAKNRFCFMSEAWENCRFNTFYLKQIHRQNDPVLVDILNNIRFGTTTPDMVEKLIQTQTQIIEKNGILATRLCCYTKEAKEINDSKLEKLPGESKTYNAVDSSELAIKLLDECTPIEKSLTLKEGAQVMLLKNVNISKGLVNGARGVLQTFKNGSPVVKFLSGAEYIVRDEKWIVKGPNGVTHTRKQLPLKLAWAFSIHKSQGLTLDCVEMSLDNTFEAGQAYVALSRAKSLNSIRVLGFQANQVWANPDVVKYYQKLMSYEQEYIMLGEKTKKTNKKNNIMSKKPLVIIR